MRIGVLALQGDCSEHIEVLHSLKTETLEVRRPDQLNRIDGLIIPGGESTTISKLIDIFDLREAILKFASGGGGVFGTCAGLIMLAKDVIDAAAGQESLNLMDIGVRRNAFGSQLDSFEQTVEFAEEKVRVAFIRAPIIESVGKNVTVLSRLEDGRIVAASEGKFLATAFHPELLGETKVHEYFLRMLK